MVAAKLKMTTNFKMAAKSKMVNKFRITNYSIMPPKSMMLFKIIRAKCSKMAAKSKKLYLMGWPNPLGH